MMTTLQFWMVPVVAAFTAWAGIVAVAAEGDVHLPRVLAAELADRRESLTTARTLHVVHLALLVLAAALGSFALDWWSWPPAVAATRLILLVLLLWVAGDLLPRLIAAIAPEAVPIARRISEPGLTLFQPLLRMVSFADRGVEPVARMMASAVDRESVHGVFALAEMTVAEVMTPRLDIVSVELRSPAREVVDQLRRSRHSRLLVVDDDPDAVVGVLYAKDLLPAGSEAEVPEDWHPLIRPALFIPEAKTLARQLRDFQRGPSHLVVVVDEFGGTAGLVTLEDILEQIVGEIQDEHDVDEVMPIQVTAPGEWLVQGGVALSELEAALAVEFEREDVNTVGGLILAELGRVARAGDSVEVAGHRFQVDQVVRRRVRRVRVQGLAAATTPAQEEPA